MAIFQPKMALSGQNYQILFMDPMRLQKWSLMVSLARFCFFPFREITYFVRVKILKIVPIHSVISFQNMETISQNWLRERFRFLLHFTAGI